MMVFSDRLGTCTNPHPQVYQFPEICDKNVRTQSIYTIHIIYMVYALDQFK